jgi:hypothetical protein
MQARLALTAFVYGLAVMVGAMIVTGYLNIGPFSEGPPEVAAVSPDEGGSPTLLCAGCHGGYWAPQPHWYGGPWHPNACCVQPYVVHPYACCHYGTVYAFNPPLVYAPVRVVAPHMAHPLTTPGATAIDPCSYGFACHGHHHHK